MSIYPDTGALLVSGVFLNPAATADNVVVALALAFVGICLLK